MALTDLEQVIKDYPALFGKRERLLRERKQYEQDMMACEMLLEGLGVSPGVDLVDIVADLRKQEQQMAAIIKRDTEALDKELEAMLNE